MTEKEKGKFNPFASVLRPDEEILGVYEPEPITARRYYRMILWPGFRWLYWTPIILTLIMVITPMMCAFLWLPTPHRVLSVIVSGCVLTMFLVQEVSTLRRLKNAYLGLYMITTQRVLTHEQDDADVVAVHLEDISDLHLIPAPTGQSIVLREDVPYLNDLADPDTVLTMIKQARENRLKTLSEVSNQ